MLRLKNKVAIVSLLGMLGLGLVGCGSKDNQVDDDIFYYYNDKNEENGTLNNGSISVSTVEIATAKCDVNVRISPIDGEVLKVLYKGESLPLLEKLDNGWYAVSYNGGVAYISGKYLDVSYEYEINSSIKDIYYTNSRVELKVPEIYSSSNKEEIISIDKNVCVEVYAEEGDLYLVSIDGHIGYIEKNNLTKLSNEFAVIDIDSKTITLYKDNVVISVIPITNNISNSTKGLFYIYEIKTDRCLIGKDYQVYVDYIAFYNDGNSYITYGSDGGVDVDESNIDQIKMTLSIGSEVIVQQ